MLSRPPRWLASSMNFFTEVSPPLAAISGISSIFR